MYNFFTTDAQGSHLGFPELEFRLQGVFLMAYLTGNSESLTSKINWEALLYQ